MYSFLKKHFLFVLVICICFQSQAQQKQLTDEQYFKGNLKTIVQPLPNATRWTDDSHFLLMKDGKTYIVDAKTGIETISTETVNKATAVPVNPKAFLKSNDLYIKVNEAEIQLTHDKDKEVNPTTSPDGKYVAYTKNNNLYTIDLNTKKETKLTADGSDVILNGYSSWVYMEEILGRPPSTRHFGGAPTVSISLFFVQMIPTYLYLPSQMPRAGTGLLRKSVIPK